MKRRKQQGIGSPGVKVGGGIGPALNPIGMGQTGPGTKYIDGTVAFEAERDNTAWNRFWRDEKAVSRFSRPVRPRV